MATRRSLRNIEDPRTIQEKAEKLKQKRNLEEFYKPAEGMEGDEGGLKACSNLDKKLENYARGEQQEAGGITQKKKQEAGGMVLFSGTSNEISNEADSWMMTRMLSFKKCACTDELEKNEDDRVKIMTLIGSVSS